MTEYDGDIDDARKIGAAWVKKDRVFRGQLEALKKVLVGTAKKSLAGVDAAVKRRDHLDPDKAEHLVAEIGTIIERLQGYTKQGQKIAGAHDRWALKEPRADLEWIRKALQLGPTSGPRYKAVAAALKNQLLDIGKELSATDELWADIRFQIKNQLTVAARLQKAVQEGAWQHIGYMDQLEEQTKQFSERGTDDIAALKVPAAARDLTALQEGHELTEQERDGKLRTYQQRLASAAKVRQTIEKNYQRIVKTVPKDVLDSRPMIQVRAQLEKQRKSFDQDLTMAEQLFKSVIKELS